MRKQTIGLAGALMLCGIGMLTGCGARGLEQAYSFQEREAQMTPAAGAGLAPFFASSLCVPESADGDIAPDDAVTAQAGALFDVTDSSVIYGKNIYDQMYPASITKVMTAIIAIEEGNLSDAVTANDDVVIREAGASMAGIKPGDTFTLEQLLYGLMIPSGNDAANAIADHIAGSTDAFVEKMNAKAKELGATHTHFVNANGLHSTDHYTTAYDLYLIFNEALKLPLFCEIINAQSYTADYTDANGAAKQQVWKGAKGDMAEAVADHGVPLQHQGHPQQGGAQVHQHTGDEGSLHKGIRKHLQKIHDSSSSRKRRPWGLAR